MMTVLLIPTPTPRRTLVRNSLIFVSMTLGGLVAAGNVAIAGASLVAKTLAPSGATMPGVGNFAHVDDRVWRGAAPTEHGYRSLASSGVRVVVDLRAEEHVVRDPALLGSLGMRLETIPVRDGQIPTDAQLARLFGIVEHAEGIVFVHCGAGVGRTGAAVAAYLVETGQAGAAEALSRNLAVGPPSLEQIAFVRELSPGDLDRPGVFLTALSRMLDAPRRLWARVKHGELF